MGRFLNSVKCTRLTVWVFSTSRVSVLARKREDCLNKTTETTKTIKAPFWTRPPESIAFLFLWAAENGPEGIVKLLLERKDVKFKRQNSRDFLRQSGLHVLLVKF